MRAWICALLLLGFSVYVPGQTPDQQQDRLERGTFYVDGIAYQYASARNVTVVAAAHSVINRKFVAVKVRVYNAGQHSVTVRPENVQVEDAVAGHALAAVPATELANKMRHAYNMARYGVGSANGNDSDAPITSDMVMNPQFLEMMRAMAARASGRSGADTLLYTDTPGALDSPGDATITECDQVCRLRLREAKATDALALLQHQTSPDSVEQYALRANTIPPRANVGGVLYFPLGKLAETAAPDGSKRKARAVRVKVPVEGESFEFVLAVE